MDGTGYPEAASARPIGLVSRILAIVDRYDAMTSARVYRSQPISPPKALTIDRDGRPGSEELVDLSATAKESGALHVLETLNLSDFGIEAMDYLL